jgi:GrpB-like predicted nucleotidyltransferase (UPF0157 family)
LDITVIKPLEEFVAKINALLDNSVLSVYCYGSATYDDFHIGYSDLDFFAIIDKAITEEDFQRLSSLRRELRSMKHPILSVLEGEIISKTAIKNDIKSNVIYWGTSKDKLTRKYSLSGFSLRGLLDKGFLVFGTDMKNQFPYPDDEEMVSQVNHMINTVQHYAQMTSENIHSMDWLFLISQSIHWLRTSNVTGKSLAALWAIDNYTDKWTAALKKALEIRQAPVLAETEANKIWLSNLGYDIQCACNTLIAERNRFLSVNSKTGELRVRDNQMRSMEVVPHNPLWKTEFSKEAAVLSSVFGDEVVKIHHIGSTAITGIYAKPIIDILVEVKDILRINDYSNRMQELGYIPREEWGISGRRYFIKGINHRTHHVHVYQSGNPEITRHLRFRDYMNAHSDEARQYEELKRELAGKYKHNPAQYTDGKDAFIKEIDRKAKEWAISTASMDQVQSTS